MYRIRIVTAAVIVALGLGTSPAATIYDDFETNGDFNGIDSGRWSTIDNTWARQNVFGTFTARSTNLGETGTGSLISAPINVPDAGVLAFDIRGWDNSGSIGNGFYPGPADNLVRIRGGNAAGPVLATLAPPRQDAAQAFRVDARGFSQVVLEAVDNNSTNAFAWLSLDNVATASLPSDRYRSTSDPLATDDFSGWAITGTALQALTKGQNAFSTRFASEGGLYMSGRETESLTGTATSPLLTRDGKRLLFDAAGYDGAGNGVNEFQLLDATGTNVLATVAAPNLEAGWASLLFDFDSAGIAKGDQFRFRAVDGGTAGFGWIAFDYVRQTPEPSSALLAVIGAFSLFTATLRRRTKR